MTAPTTTKPTSSAPSLFNDALAGFFVFLIALPLCLGISIASGFPTFAGIITAVVGGLVVSFFMGAPLTIKGPAAGLIVIVLSAVEELGAGDAMRGYKLALACVVISGLVQVAFGWLKAGKLVTLFPLSAVHGMLAAIGIIIMSKQVHVMLGVVPHAKEPLELLLEVPRSLAEMDTPIAVLGFSGLALLALWPMLQQRVKVLKSVPGPLLVLLLGVAGGFLIDLEHEHLVLGHIVGPKNLVSVPQDLLGIIATPDFSQVATFASVKYVILMALIGSLESALSVKAVDLLDPEGRKSDPNRDLLAVGIGNTISGMLGGLPMIAEIVRSSANVGYGAKSRWSNFAHGAFLLSFVAFVPWLVHRIPLAALAAMLVFTGFRLASPKEFGHALSVGREQLAIFVTTVIVTLATDLLVGIGVGIVVKLAFHLFRGVPARQLLGVNFAHEKHGEEHRIVVKGSLVFTNLLPLRERLDAIPLSEPVVVDVSESLVVDHTALELLHHEQVERGQGGGALRIEAHADLAPVSAHALAARVRGPQAA